MFLSNLKVLYEDMVKENEARCIFAVQVLNKGFSCIFMTDTKPYCLYISSLGENAFAIEYEVTDNCKIKNIYLGDNRQLLQEYLNIKFSSDNIYLPRGFLADLNETIPPIFARKPKRSETLSTIGRVREIEEADKVYFCGWRNNPATERVSYKNYEKTKIAFDETIANRCKEQNISSRWSANPNDEVQVKLSRMLP